MKSAISHSLQDIVEYRGDRLFQGAVNIDWLVTDLSRAKVAAQSFVFHGPSYHGVAQDDVGTLHGHRLQDTASFTRSFVRRCYGLEDEPFTLAIAGYGTGKSHLGVTLGSLLADPSSELAAQVLSGLHQADPAIASEIKAILAEERQPCLVVAVNGMRDFDLTTEVTRQLLHQVRIRGADTRPLDNLRPRFAQAASLVQIASSNHEVVEAIQKICETESLEEVLAALERQEESTYAKVHSVLASKNINITAFGGESIRDVIELACREYCGNDKPFRSLAILFDEFGRYTEFATIRSHVAGSGVLQDLFEGIQGSLGKAYFAGFIQFELNAYVQRVAPEYRNEILRYVTRYQGAKRVYLSINLETLIASLLEKKRPEELAQWFDTVSSKEESEQIVESLRRRFPQIQQHRLWNDSDRFHNVVRKGCWPLSPCATWLLFHLTAAGKHLQSRTALAFLGDALARSASAAINDSSFAIYPVDLWSNDLRQELITAEEGGQLGMITHAYASVEARHGVNLGDNLQRLLRAIVLASKLGLKADDKDDAIEALSEIAGVHLAEADKGVKQLLDELNVIAWDDAFKQFDILGDSVPRTEFLAFLRNRVASAYDEGAKAALFASKAGVWCDLISDQECEFAEERSISSREWRYIGIPAKSDYVQAQLKLAGDRWIQALGVDEPRGTVLYCYIEPSQNAEAAAKEYKTLLRSAASQVGTSVLPVLIVLIHDEDGAIGQSLAELSVLNDSLSEEEKARFQNLIAAHIEKHRELLRLNIDKAIKKRNYVSGTPEPLEAQRLSRACTELFARVYRSPINFPFDGFSTARGNAADSCQELTIDLIGGKLDFDAVLSKPVRIKNRAVAVLKDSWGVFSQNGQVRTRPVNTVLRVLTEKWDDRLINGNRRIDVAEALRELCAPPYGANLASAGLFLGVFIAARSQKLLVLIGDQQISITQWLKNGIFKAKFIDLTALRDTSLIQIGEESGEWDRLLDEWEEEKSHLGRVACLNRSLELAKRVPVPPLAGVRKAHLEALGKQSSERLVRLEEQQNQAQEKIEHGLQRADIARISWGTALLIELSAKMKEEMPAWTAGQISEMEPVIARARETIILNFDTWLSRQSPNDGTPAGAGEFRHRMIQLIGTNLRKLGLDAQLERLERHTSERIRAIETVAEAQQLIHQVKAWLTTHSDATRFVRVAELRALREVGKAHASSLQGLAARIQMPAISEVRELLSQKLNEMRNAEAELEKRAKKLWNSSLQSVNEIDPLIQEVTVLLNGFEGCASDLEDLCLMRKALGNYRDAYGQLSDEQLSWSSFDDLVIELKKSLGDSLGEQELPWFSDEVVDSFAAEVKKKRTAAGKDWIDSIEAAVSRISEVTAQEANQLHSRLNNPPPVLTEGQEKRRLKAVSEVEKRLNSFLLEWLVEKFKEMPSPLRKEFLKQISTLI